MTRRLLLPTRGPAAAPSERGPMTRTTSRPRLAVAVLLSGLLTLAGVAAGTAPARADSAPADPTAAVTPTTVSADALPTVQINGVVWSQVVVGNTVYAAGSFTSARPAGAAAGTSETVRNNLLAYDIRTGDLITSFAPDLNAQALAVAASPDGSTLYVGGAFSQANGVGRYSIAAYSTATGKLLTTFAPVVGANVRAIAATNTTVYVGGDNFGVAGGATRNYLAAFDAATGAVLPWAPLADNVVDALAVVNNGAAVAIGGHLTKLNGTTVAGLGEVDATTGKNLTFAASTFTTNGGTSSGFTSLTTDAGGTLYASGYSFGTGNLEGVLSINPVGGAVTWVDDCHGDTYSVYAASNAEYIAGHAHVCSNLGGYPQVNPDNDALWTYRRAIAFSKTATGTVGVETGNFSGKAAPSLLNWFPIIEAGTYTGQNQGPWSVTGNGTYVVYGGEFPTVNGTKQQGLVRFAVPTTAPNKVGPDATTGLTTTLSSTVTGTVNVSWQGTSDPDNQTLTYDLYRSDKPDVPIYETTVPSSFWALPTMSFTDRTAKAGSSVAYSVKVHDPFGNTVAGKSTAVTVSATAAATGTATDDYADAVLATGPTDYWRLDASSGTALADTAGTYPLTAGTGVTLKKTGALTGRTDTAATFSGTSAGTASTRTLVQGPNTFSAEAWFSTTSKTGGKLIGFGDKTTGTSSNYDRQVGINGSGQVTFGVNDDKLTTVKSPASYNNGAWHHVVATMSSTTGMALYVDGQLVGSDATVHFGQVYSGYWRVGGDQTWDGSGPYLAGSLDEVAVYPTALTAAQITQHYTLGKTAPAANTPPTASFTSAVSAGTVAVDGSGSTDAKGAVTSWTWDFGDGTTGTGVTASHTYAASGTYTVKLTAADAAGLTGSTTRTVTVTVPAAGSTIAADAFGRVFSAGLGTADVGGTWTISGGKTNASVGGGTGQLVAAAATGTGASLPIATQDVDVAVSVALTKPVTGGGGYVTVGTRTVGDTRYETELKYASDGSVTLILLSDVNGTETELGRYALPGSYAAGTVLRVRTEAVGKGTTTLVSRAWVAGTAEPTGWQVTATDKTAALQVAGGLYLELYTSKSATAAQTMQIDDLAVTVPGPVSTNVVPTAAFTATATGLAVAVDGSAATDPDGTVASWAWTYGDGGTGTGKTATHTYAAGGSYPVTLTVTDNSGATTALTKTVVVTAPAPAPSTAADAFGRTVTGGWGTADTGGAWKRIGTAASAAVADGTGQLTSSPATGVQEDLPISVQDVAVQADVQLDKAPTGGGSYVNLAGRNVDGNEYNVQLWFSSAGTVLMSLLSEVNGTETSLGAVQLPGTYTPGTSLTVRLDASGNGTTTLHASAWAAGSAAPAAWQLTATDATAALQKAGGTEVGLYVSKSATGAQTVRVDNLWAGASGTTPTGATAPVGTAPTASFAAEVTGAAVAVDGSASTDPDGPVAGWAWDFGDGATGTGKTASHTYTASGTYLVKLTVTDGSGATGTSSRSVTVTVPAPAPSGVLASDAFARTVAAGWGTADVGGAWTAGSTVASVSGGVGTLTAKPGITAGAQLPLSAQDLAVQADLTLAGAATGGGSYVTLATRTVDWTRYETQLRYASDGSVVLQVLAQVQGNETVLGSSALPGTYTPGTALTVRTEASGTGTTTLHAKVWVTGTTEPAWQITATDSSAALQRAGALVAEIYQSKSATSAGTLQVDNLWAGAAGTKP